MTRINAGIPPAELSDKHLLAEHREIKRIPNMVKSGRANLSGIPEKFTLGKGHVKFFYNKLRYLYIRYIKIHEECKKRGFNVTDFSDAFLLTADEYNDILMKCWNDWTPPREAIELIRQRIKERS